MSRLVDDRINRLAVSSPSDALCGGLKGIEKESLRVNPAGMLSNRSHPQSLGSALSNRYITTDFSEALLEFVTPPYANTWEALRLLCEIHQFTYGRIGDELLWATSMPCQIPADHEIPIARYGSSNVGTMKTVYRNGLGYRYGRSMQTIAGIHFNYSLPDSFWPTYQQLEERSDDPDAFRSESYLGMIRNFRRFGWLVLYLFGASPALCKSFGAASSAGMPEFDAETYYEPFGTSLRMSDLGYTSQAQARIDISLNSLDEYISDLTAAICTPDSGYEQIGIKVDGEYRQLSANQLQIENEYYSSIRPKRVAHSGERPTAALLRGGIEYVEVRSLDINLFDPVGINQNVMRFMEAFLIYCMLEDSPPLDDAAWHELSLNLGNTARNGRNSSLRLIRNGNETSLQEWADEILVDVKSIAALIDRASDRDDYVDAVDAQFALVDDSDATPSARILQELRTAGIGFFRFAMETAIGHKDYFRALQPLESERLKLFEREAEASLQRQEDVEAADSISFDEYLARYFSDGS